MPTFNTDFQRIIVKINELYNTHNANIEDEIFIRIESIPGSLRNDIKELEALNVIDENSKKLNIKKFLILRGYINRTPQINVDGRDMIILIDKLLHKYYNNKQVRREIEKLWYEDFPSDRSFFWEEKLDIWSMINFYWLDLYSHLTQLIKEENPTSSEKYQENNNSETVFEYEKIWRTLYIKYLSKGIRYKIKKVELSNCYDIVSEYMQDQQSTVFLRENIESESTISLHEWLSRIKMVLGFKDVLAEIFFDGATQDSFVFYKKVDKERLLRLEKSEEEVEEYLNRVCLKE